MAAEKAEGGDMKISTLFRIVYNVIRFQYLKMKSKNRFSYEGISFFSPLTRVLVGKGTIHIGKNMLVEKNGYFSAASGGCLEIGEKTFFNRNSYVACRNKIQIGKDCNFGPNVSIYDHDHNFDSQMVYKDQYSVGEVQIGDGCWIGDNVIILKNTKIGSGSVIGAGTVIHGEIPAHSLVIASRDVDIIPIARCQDSCQ
jgi:acetyltransferase-like isoleucine patch superfamily enzyme